MRHRCPQSAPWWHDRDTRVCAYGPADAHVLAAALSSAPRGSRTSQRLDRPPHRRRAACQAMRLQDSSASTGNAGMSAAACGAFSCCARIMVRQSRRHGSCVASARCQFKLWHVGARVSPPCPQHQAPGEPLRTRAVAIILQLANHVNGAARREWRQKYMHEPGIEPEALASPLAP